VLLQDANDLLFAETASLHRLSPQLENRLTSNRGLFRGAGHFDPDTPESDELRLEVLKLAKRWQPKKKRIN